MILEQLSNADCSVSALSSFNISRKQNKKIAGKVSDLCYFIGKLNRYVDLSKQ
ncbi:hypothetical protein CPS_1362 [Colwellia psychrerythraea 34H]|uniref:Uncharacterized protein n=1 Tax=Colwellia psychrerythraea (strain 34H / ATCC BAA-681) TaxID=167879 RepID=Q486B0_COLP3|nr:hypothetical protein CPS_1362 [Colwellia psychrerythraea 34H]